MTAALRKQFELEGRAQKVIKIVTLIDAKFIGINRLSKRFAASLRSMNREWWDDLGKAAKIERPSLETIEEVVTFFRNRAIMRIEARKR